jgi:hypothetical protein
MTDGKQNGTDRNEAFGAKPKRRMRRGKLVFVRHRGDKPRTAELNPEATRSTDQTLTEISLRSANSDSNAALLRERQKAADRCEHIKSGLSAKQKAVLTKVLDVVEVGDSLREIGRKAGLHATQVSRAFEAAREADKRRVFSKRASRQRPYKPYNPRCVPMETVMMPHQGPTLYTITVPDRPMGTAPAVNKMPSPKTPMAPDLSAVQSESQSAQTISSASSGPEPKSQVVPWPSGRDARSLPNSLKSGSKFAKLKQLYSSCFQWVKRKMAAFTGSKHPVYRDESIRPKSPGM